MSAVAGPSRGRPQSATADVDEDALLSLIEGFDTFELRGSERRARDGHGTDTDVSLALLAEDARRLSQVRDDRALAQILAEEVDEDVPIAARPIHAHRERVVPVPGAPGNATQPQATVTDNAATPDKANGVTAGSSWFTPVTSFFSWLASTDDSADTRPTGHDCVVCQDPIIGREVRAPCGHFYDKSCILDLFESATRDESLFPPRCCRQPIPLASVQSLMSKELLSTFKEKSVEFGTPNRVYCAEPRCSRFLGPHVTPASRALFWSTGWYECSSHEHKHLVSRRAYTCSTCKVALPRDQLVEHRCAASALHGGDAETLRLGAAQGWARCPGCEQLIELNMGCYHMTCRCRTEFCYLCRTRWKNCRCPQWDENRLLAAAEARVDQQFGAAVAPAPIRREWVPPPAVPAAPVRAPAPAPAPAPARPATNARAREPAIAIPPTTARTWGDLASNNGRSWREREAALRNSRTVAERSTLGSAAHAALTSTPMAGSSRTPTTSQMASAPHPRRSPITSAGTTSSSLATTSSTRAPVSQAPSGSASSSGSSGQYKTIHCGCRIPVDEPDPWAKYGLTVNDTSTTTSTSPNMKTAASSPRGGSLGSPSSRVFNSAGSPVSSGKQVSSPSSGSSSSGAGIDKWHSSMHLSLNPSSPVQTSAGLSARPNSNHKGKSPITRVPATQQKLSQAERARLVREAMDELRVNHDCDHSKWRYRHGGGRCENCFHDLPTYLLRCQGCRMLACKRCRHNRL